MNLKQALAASPVKQAIRDDGNGLMVLVTQLRSGAYSVSVIMGTAVFLSETVRDEKAVEQVLWEHLSMREIAFEPVHTRSYTASPFRTKPESTRQAGRSGWLALLFPLAMLVRCAIRIGERRPRPVRKAHWWQPEQEVQWLHFLTRQALERQSLVFSVEDLQPDWLQHREQRLYRWSVRLVLGLGSGLIFGLGSAIFISQAPVALDVVLLSAVLCGLLFGVLCGLLFRPGEGLRPEKTIIWNRSWLNWSKGDLAFKLFLELLPGLTIGMITDSLLHGSLLLGWVLIPFFMLLMGLPVGLFWPGGHLIKRSLLSPNEGTQQTGTLGLLIWLIDVLLCGLFCGMFVGLIGICGLVVSYTPLGRLLFGILFYYVVGMLFPIWLLAWLPTCLSAGPAMVAQPLLLRLFLRLSNRLPWDLLSLLDQAAERGLLRKVGESYRLSYRLLRSYFDSLDEPMPPEIAALHDPFIVTSHPAFPVAGKPAIITYESCLFETSESITMHWGYNTWKGITDTPMTRECDGTWQATITIPPEATVLNLAFSDQSYTWDNHQHSDYHLPVREGLTLASPPGRRRVSRRRMLIGLGALTGIAGAAVGVWRYYLPYPIYTYRGHRDVVWAVAWSPDGRRIASRSTDETVQVWDAADGRHVLTYRGDAEAVAWSPDGTRLALATREVVQIWDTTTGRTTLTYRGHSDTVYGVTWSPDGEHLASASGDKTVRIWDAATGHTILTYQGHSDIVDVVAWSPDGERLASGSEDRTVQIWDATTGRTILTYRGHRYGVDVVAWSPDGKRIASSSGTVQVWEATTGRTILTYQGHTSVVCAVAWSPDGRRIASASEDQTVQIWDAIGGRTISTYRGHTGLVYGVAWSPDGKRIASASDDKTVQIWDAPQ